MKCKCGNVKNVENVENENRKTIRALVASLFENGNANVEV